MSRLIEIARKLGAVVLVVVGVPIGLLVILAGLAAGFDEWVWIRAIAGPAVLVGSVIGAARLAPSIEIVRKSSAVVLVVFCVPVGLLAMWLGFYATQYGKPGLDGPDPEGWIAFVAGSAVVVGSVAGATRLALRAQDGQRPKIGKLALLCIGWLIFNATLIGLGLALRSWPPILAVASTLLGIPLIVARVRLKVFWTAWALAVTAALMLPNPAAWIVPIGVVVVALAMSNSAAESDRSEPLESDDEPLGEKAPPD